jgi:hypothetical protein
VSLSNISRLARPRRDHPKIARLATIVAGILQLVLAVWWAIGALFVGSGNYALAAIAGVYAVALGSVGFELVLPAPTPRRWPALGLGLSIAPVVLAVLIWGVAPASGQPATDQLGLLLFQLGVAGSCALALYLNPPRTSSSDKP